MLTTLACERPQPVEPATSTIEPATSTIEPATSTIEPPTSTIDPPASTIDPALVMDCVSMAVEKMGWLGQGAHAGHFIATARDAGLVPAACDPLTSESYAFGYPLADGGTLHWFPEDIQPAGEDVEVTLTFTCHETGCSIMQTRSVILPPGWFCLGWIHLHDHGTQCFRSEAECEQGRKDIPRETTPCGRDAGAAFCAIKGQETRCFPSPWACTRESGGSLVDGTCKRTDR